MTADKYTGEQKLVDVLLEQYYQYIKHYGKEPKKIVFNSKHYLNQLETEASALLFYDVNNTIRRHEYMGMEIIFLKDVYGGSFNWGFGE